MENGTTCVSVHYSHSLRQKLPINSVRRKEKFLKDLCATIRITLLNVESIHISNEIPPPDTKISCFYPPGMKRSFFDCFNFFFIRPELLAYIWDIPSEFLDFCMIQSCRDRHLLSMDAKTVQKHSLELKLGEISPKKRDLGWLAMRRPAFVRACAAFE